MRACSRFRSRRKSRRILSSASLVLLLHRLLSRVEGGSGPSSSDEEAGSFLPPLSSSDTFLWAAWAKVSRGAASGEEEEEEEEDACQFRSSSKHTAYSSWRRWRKGKKNRPGHKEDTDLGEGDNALVCHTTHDTPLWGLPKGTRRRRRRRRPRRGQPCRRRRFSFCEKPFSPCCCPVQLCRLPQAHTSAIYRKGHTDMVQLKCLHRRRPSLVEVDASSSPRSRGRDYPLSK